MRTQEDRYSSLGVSWGKNLVPVPPSFIMHIVLINYLFCALAFCFVSLETNPICFDSRVNYYTVAQLVYHRAAMRDVVSSTPAEPTLRVLK